MAEKHAETLPKRGQSNNRDTYMELTQGQEMHMEGEVAYLEIFWKWAWRFGGFRVEDCSWQTIQTWDGNRWAGKDKK